MDTKTITTALGLPEDASDRDILDRIRALRQEVGEDDVADLSDRELLRRGQHERVTIDGEGAHVTLYFPFKSGAETVETLLLRRPNAKQLRKLEAAQGGDFSRGLALVADISGRAPAEIDKLDAADAALCVLVAGFLQRPPRRTGSRS